MSTDLSIWSEMMNCLISRLEFLITQKSNSTLLTFATMIVSGNHFFPSVTHMQKLFGYCTSYKMAYRLAFLLFVQKTFAITEQARITRTYEDAIDRTST